MFGITDLAAYLIGTTAIILVPGPNSMYCLSVAGQYGVKTAYRSIFGILLGDSLLMLATVLGAGTLLKLYPVLFHGVQLLGGLYLAYIGWQLLKGAAQTWKNRLREQREADERTPPKHVFKRALALSLTNPKAILFFLSFFVQFVDPTYPHPALSFLVLAILLQLISFAYLNVLAFAGDRLVQAFRTRRKLAALGMAAVGVLFIGFALKLWMSSIE